MEQPINRGALSGHKKSDYIQGSMPWENRNPSGDWTPYLVRGERQYFKSFDSMSCVSFAVLSSFEMQIKQQTGREVNFSDRFLSKMSGTTQQGNWVYIVLDTWNKVGCVLEDEWPKPLEPATWEIYSAPIPQFIINRAPNQSLVPFGPNRYEVITDFSPENIRRQLQHAPLLITLPGHEVDGIVVRADDKTMTIFDTYEYVNHPENPYLREVKLSDITDIYKAVITVKGDKRMIGYKVQGNPTTYVEVQGKLVPLADWKAFTSMGGSTESVIDLTPEQFGKFTKVETVLFKSKE